MDELITVGEAVTLLADLGLAVKSKTLRRWAATGALRSLRTPGGQHRFRRADVVALVAQPTAVNTEAS